MDKKIKKGEVWSLNPNKKVIAPPLVLVLEKIESSKWLVAPIFEGDENATHNDRLIYPYQEWLYNEDWLALSNKIEINENLFFNMIGTIPKEVFTKIETKKLPKGNFLVEGIGDEREEFHKEMKKELKLLTAEKKTSKLISVIIKNSENIWQAVNGIFVDLEESLSPDFAPIRGNEKNDIKILEVESIQISLRDRVDSLEIMDIKDSKFEKVEITTSEKKIECRKIGKIWIPKQNCLLKKNLKISVEKDKIVKNIEINFEIDK